MLRFIDVCVLLWESLFFSLTVRYLDITTSDTRLMFSLYCAQLVHPHFRPLPVNSLNCLCYSLAAISNFLFKPLYHDWNLAEVAVMKERKQ